jgi:hypothetical protein
MKGLGLKKRVQSSAIKPNHRSADLPLREHPQEKTQALAATKAGISERRIKGSVTLSSHNPRRYWRSRADPFIQTGDAEVVPLLRKLQEDHPNDFPDGLLRTSAMLHALARTSAFVCSRSIL